MTGGRNGVFVKWALGFLALVLIGLGGWAGKTLVDHGERISSAESQSAGLKEWLGRVEDKLDKALNRP